ncbi:hypothetical protein ACFL9T_12315 [Thermodesulfobacteriota bacterium]
MADDQMLGQDDIDALLAQSDKTDEGEASSEDQSEAPEEEQKLPAETEEPLEQPSLKTAAKSIRKSNSEVRAMTTQLFNKAFLQRDDGVKVIWNALGVIPMNAGVNMKIQGMEYVTMGILHQKHLVVGVKD